MKTLKIVWDKKAIVQFGVAIEYINKDSLTNALHVKSDITEIINLLLKYPEKYPPDKDKADNIKSEYRAFEKHRLRISYRFYNTTIRIVRIRHTSQNPLTY